MHKIAKLTFWALRSAVVLIFSASHIFKCCNTAEATGLSDNAFAATNTFLPNLVCFVEDVASCFNLLTPLQEGCFNSLLLFNEILLIFLPCGRCFSQAPQKDDQSRQDRRQGDLKLHQLLLHQLPVLHKMPQIVPVLHF